MRNPPPSASAPNTWLGHKSQGRAHFQREEYEEALVSYRAALNPEYGCPSSERQIVLSNVVACRLKIGGSAHARAAVEEAKQCIALNSSWAKGHVRLASAYVALGDHSNDACNELQKALALDPGNPTARQMLVRELRRDKQPPAASDDALPEDSAPPATNPDYVPPESGSSSFQLSEDEGIFSETRSTTPRPHQDSTLQDDIMIDDSLSWSDRLKFHVSRAASWYHEQSDDVKTILIVVLSLIVLYVAFGGRFGLDSLGGSRHENRGNYERGNAYDRYYSRAANNDRYSSYESEYSSSHGGYRYNGRHGDYQYERQQRRRSGSLFMPSLTDGSFQSLLVIGGILYLCHRNGINPFHALMMMNLFAGRRGGVRQMGLAGLGYGAYYGGRRRRNGWY